MTKYGPGWHTRGQGCTRGFRGAPGGARGFTQLPAAKRVIKTAKNGPKPWFKVSKVCPDPKRMVLLHFWSIWGHLDALKQRYLVKTPNVENLGFINFSVRDFHRPNGAKILRFRNFPHTLTYPQGVENCQKSKLFSKIWLWKSGNLGYFLAGQENNPTFNT